MPELPRSLYTINLMGENHRIVAMLQALLLYVNQLIFVQA